MTEPSEASIRALPNGPFLVTGDLRLVWKAPVDTERGEPIAWRTGPEVPHPSPCALCRCGQSDNKPFCDGSHARVGFQGADTADTADTRRDRAKEYAGVGIVVTDDRSICTHAGFCGTAATNVWKMVRRTGDTDVRSQAIAMIERCPSGALSYTLTGVDAELEPDLPRQIAITPDGPLWITGRVPVETSAGGNLEERNRVTLCRCGQSANKPLCDGSHKDAGFRHGPPPEQPRVTG